MTLHKRIWAIPVTCPGLSDDTFITVKARTLWGAYVAFLIAEPAEDDPVSMAMHDAAIATGRPIELTR